MIRTSKFVSTLRIDELMTDRYLELVTESRVHKLLVSLWLAWIVVSFLGLRFVFPAPAMLKEKVSKHWRLFLDYFCSVCSNDTSLDLHSFESSKRFVEKRIVPDLYKYYSKYLIYINYDSKYLYVLWLLLLLLLLLSLLNKND